MIQFLVIIAGLAVLASIFVRRYMLVEKGVTAFSVFGRKQKAVDLLNMGTAGESNEVTVEEMIPDRSTIELKKIAKADTMMKKADAALAQGDAVLGEKLLIQALALDPSNLDAYHRLGLIYLRQNQFGKAEMMYQKLVLSAQNDPVYYSNLAVALYQQKKLEEAKKHYKKAIELDASRAGRFFSLAQVLQELGEMQEAIEHFQKAIAMDPSNLDYLLTLAQAYIETDMRHEARSLLGEILAAYPDHQMAREMMEKANRDDSKKTSES